MKQEIVMIDDTELLLILAEFNGEELNVIERFNKRIEDALHKEEKE